MRRTGDHRPVRVWPEWGPHHPVARTTATGSHWLDAWTAETSTPWDRLERASSVSIGRLMAMASGDRLTRAELDRLAAAWKVDAAQVIASLGDPLLLAD